MGFHREGRINYVASALQAEALACMEAVHASAAWGMGCIELESDSTILVSA
jgi:ribonuclease HI